MKPIKRKTYYNLMRVVKMIQDKGYDFDTAVRLAHQLFDQYEFNPNGLPILTMVGMVIPADDYHSSYC